MRAFEQGFFGYGAFRFLPQWAWDAITAWRYFTALRQSPQRRYLDRVAWASSIMLSRAANRRGSIHLEIPARGFTVTIYDGPAATPS